ncbi:MAG: stage III sporulation protein AG [Clostridiales bacterium]|nr:stage III sporulation protein AG [Clostridiales bacterium]
MRRYMDKIRQLLESGKWKERKKSDWIVLGLFGVLLLIIAMPIKTKETKLSEKEIWRKEEAQGEMRAEDESKTERGESYTESLEKKLESVLERMEGVGNVKVMITIADSGEQVVEKDATATTTTTTESDHAGGSRAVTESNTTQATVYVETGAETYPYVRKEKLPEIEGIVVVAEGGGSPSVISNISDAIKALFPVEPHRIKVVKMCSREE